MKRWPTWTCSGRTTSSTRASTARSTVWPKVKSRGVRVSRAESLYGREEFQTFGRVRALRRSALRVRCLLLRARAAALGLRAGGLGSRGLGREGRRGHAAAGRRLQLRARGDGAGLLGRGGSERNRDRERTRLN